jgi:hypothetical protein
MRTELEMVIDGKRLNARDVKISFGPHYVVELRHPEDEAPMFSLVATHHGFKADASKLDGELEQIIELVRKMRPEAIVD